VQGKIVKKSCFLSSKLFFIYQVLPELLPQVGLELFTHLRSK